MTEGLDDQLWTRLRPYLDRALETGSDLIADVGSEIGQKAAGGLTGLSLKAAGAIHRGVRNRIARSRAKDRLDNEIDAAKTAADREAAYRRFLGADPRLSQSLAALIERRDYLVALAEMCEDLPVADLVPGGHRLTDVFLPPDLLPTGNQTDTRPVPLTTETMSAEVDHLVIGDAGSGKSSLARWLTIAAVRELLGDAHVGALDQSRLPIYLSAADLPETNWTDALHQAVSKQIGLRGMSPLTDRFFDPNATHGHRKMDGFHRWPRRDRR